MNFLTLMVILALIAAVAALIWGVSSMAHGGSYDREHSEQIMFTRRGTGCCFCPDSYRIDLLYRLTGGSKCEKKGTP